MIDEKALLLAGRQVGIDITAEQNKLFHLLVERYESAKEPVALKACVDALQGVADLNEHGTGMNYETMTKAVLDAAGVTYKEGV